LSAGASPQTPLGSLQRSPNLVTVFRGPTSRGREKREKVKQRKNGRREKGKEGRIRKTSGPP